MFLELLSTPIGQIGLVIIAIIGLIGIVNYLLTRNAADRLGLNIETKPKTARRGEALKVLMHTNPVKNTKVSKIIIKITCTKVKNRRILLVFPYGIPSIVDTREVTMEGQTLNRGEAEIIEGAIEIPYDGLVTNKFRHDEHIIWYLDVIFKVGLGKAIKHIELPVT